jgi:hypothetical protein
MSGRRWLIRRQSLWELVREGVSLERRTPESQIPPQADCHLLPPFDPFSGSYSSFLLFRAQALLFFASFVFPPPTR